jgi:hypothetical protein
VRRRSVRSPCTSASASGSSTSGSMDACTKESRTGLVQPERCPRDAVWHRECASGTVTEPVHRKRFRVPSFRYERLKDAVWSAPACVCATHVTSDHSLRHRCSPSSTPGTRMSTSHRSPPPASAVQCCADEAAASRLSGAC